MVCSRLVASRTSSPLAMADRVSPRRTGPYCDDASAACGAMAGAGCGAGATGTGCGVGAMAVLSPGSGSGSMASGSAATGSAAAGAGSAAGRSLGGGAAAGGAGSGSATGAGRCTTAGSGVAGTCTVAGTGALAVCGTSISAEYSRTSRPWPQSTSIRKFSTAWSTGRTVVTRITGRPRASLPRLNCRSAASPLGGDRPTRRKVSGEASRACSACSSPGVVETIRISASNGWLRRDLTSIWPSPSAHALPAASTKAAASAMRSLPITRSPQPRCNTAL
ncbi:hypothetical protein MASR1M8_11320 [Thermomonas brevis]